MDSTWAAALLLAMFEVDAGAPVLLAFYDHPMPAAYCGCAMWWHLGVGLVLAPSGAGGFAHIVVAHEDGASQRVEPDDQALAALAAGNPAAQSLRLLEHLARRSAGHCDASLFRRQPSGQGRSHYDAWRATAACWRDGLLDRVIFG